MTRRFGPATGAGCPVCNDPIDWRAVCNKGIRLIRLKSWQVWRVERLLTRRVNRELSAS